MAKPVRRVRLALFERLRVRLLIRLLIRLLMGLLLGVMLPQQVQADELMSALVEQLKQGQVSEIALQGKGVQSADSLFLLGWLYHQGRYGVAKNPQRAEMLLQQAAEKGQFDAMRYCWSSCLQLTAAVQQQLRQGVAQQQPQALYLQALSLQLPAVEKHSSQKQSLPNQNDQLSRSLLERAAKLQHSDAAAHLYVDQFVQWARLKRGFTETKSKLERCVNDGLTVCYYLLGAFYQKHDYPQWALFFYQLLSLVDLELYRSYQLQSQQAGLLSQRPQADLGVVRLRAASYLSQRIATGNDRIDRFQQCRAVSGLDCVERISQVDQQCLLSYFEATHLRDLRDSVGFGQCVDQLAGSGW